MPKSAKNGFTCTVLKSMKLCVKYVGKLVEQKQQFDKPQLTIVLQLYGFTKFIILF